MNSYAILLISCQDQLGIAAKVTSFLARYHGNIVDIDQHVEDNKYFMRVKWSLDNFGLAREQIKEVFEQEVTNQLTKVDCHLFLDNKPRMAIFVSKASHCLFDILARRDSYQVEIPLIISNHKTLEPIAKSFDIPFYYLAVNKDNKLEMEKKQLALLQEHKVDFVVLARYMQILSTSLIENYPNKIINIHHSFLPAFPGAKPYHQAFKRGVKIIGATSHYVTSQLDEGPIIEQDVARVSHNDCVKDLIRKGKDLEKIVLSRAIYDHLNRKIITHKNKTFVF